ncbi:triosephosphate isomerase [Candidatus Roizmanbacteria bacterium]|nr:triosephosphate isomerase [Candidatus Roizmanbacteria bacterium]
MHYIIANWKATKNLEEAEAWLKQFLSYLEADRIVRERLESGALKIVICPAYHLLSVVKSTISSIPNFAIGTQDVSSFEAGNFTGEVSARNLSGLVEFAIIGHSERRQYLGETNETVEEKTSLSKKYGIAPIVCIRDKNDVIPHEAELVAYEPVYAIGTGENEPLEKVLALRQSLQLGDNMRFLYGGSVNEHNIVQYSSAKEIDGFLIGTASYEAKSFYNAIRASL